MKSITELAAEVKAAAPALARASSEQKNEALLAAADALVERADAIVLANEKDLVAGEAVGLTHTVLDRLRLDEGRVSRIADGLRQVATLPDPIGEITDGWLRPNGLRIRRVRVPLGVVGVIYENRPNVTSDAAGLCLKSGNAAFLRGSSGAINSNIAIAAALQHGLRCVGLPTAAVTLVEDTSRESAIAFMQQRQAIDCLIPRGGPGLIASILDNATVPFVVDGAGNCHIYVDQTADLHMAERIVVNAKTQRPSVCNAAESLLVHQAVANTFLPRIHAAMTEVTLVGDTRTRAILPGIGAATDDDFGREFLDLCMSVAVVDGVQGAINHIATFGSGHSEAVIATDHNVVATFINEVDAAAVVVNASTRFVDGEEFGFGAEIGISTQKLHCRGPMGLQQLTTLKYVVEGSGQVRV